MPQSKTIKNMVADQKAKAVRFDWQGRHFLVQTSLQVFELKQSRLYATGASTLLHIILATKTNQQTIIGDVVEKFDEALNLLKGDTLKGLELIKPIKSSLARLAGRRVATKRAG